MKGKPAVKAQPQPPPRAATPQDISRAIDELSQANLVRLSHFAANRIYRIGPRAACGRAGDDLLQTAVERLLDGTRHWYPEKTDILRCLLGVIKSISSAWAGFRKRNAWSPEYATLETDLIKKDGEGEGLLLFDALSAGNGALNVEEQAIEAETEAEQKALADEIEALCVDDEPASMVILG